MSDGCEMRKLSEDSMKENTTTTDIPHYTANAGDTKTKPVGAYAGIVLGVLSLTIRNECVNFPHPMKTRSLVKFFSKRSLRWVVR